MAKKYLITLQDEAIQQLETYLNWKEKLLLENAGIKYKPTPTGTLTQIVTDFLSNLNYGSNSKL